MLKMPFPFSVISPYPAQFAVVPANQAYLSHEPNIRGRISDAMRAIAHFLQTDGHVCVKGLGTCVKFIIGGAIITTF